MQHTSEIALKMVVLMSLRSSQLGYVKKTHAAPYKGLHNLQLVNKIMWSIYIWVCHYLRAYLISAQFVFSPSGVVVIK